MINKNNEIINGGFVMFKQNRMVYYVLIQLIASNVILYVILIYYGFFSNLPSNLLIVIVLICTLSPTLSLALLEKEKKS